MALEIDAFHVLNRIASQSALAPLRAEAATQAGKFTDTLRKLLAKHVKAQAAHLDALRATRVALGAETFDLVVEGMKDSEIKTLVGKLDKHHPQQKAANAIWRRGHLRALAGGAIEPAPAAPMKPKGGTSKSRAGGKTSGRGRGSRSGKRAAPAESDYLDDPSAGATRDRDRS
jgi:hypothetical protein